MQILWVGVDICMNMHFKHTLGVRGVETFTFTRLMAPYSEGGKVSRILTSLSNSL